MADLPDLLDRATDAIEAQGGAAEALRVARRRRTRRRGTVAALAAATAVAAVVVAVQVGTGSTDGTAPPPAESPTATTDPATAPEIARDRIQPVWDPQGAESMPVVDLGVPRVMEDLVDGVVTDPVAVLDDGAQSLLVDGDGTRQELALPDGLGEWRTVSLSPDGTRLAAVGISGFFWRPVDGGEWQRVDVPRSVTGEYPEVTWTPDGASLVLRTHLAGHRVDLDTGDQERLPMLANFASWDFAPDATIVTTGRPGVREWVDGAVVREVALGPLENLQRPVVGETFIAASRANTSWGEERLPDDSDGLIAIDRETLETRGFLRVPYEASYYVDGGALSPVGWLDDETVLFTVLPKGAPKHYLMTWDVETGDVSRVSCWDESFRAVFATDLLG